MKKILFLILFLLIPSIAFMADEDPSIKSSSSTNLYVQDQANLLSASVINALEEKSKEINKATTAQIAVVTVKTLNGKSIETVAHDLFRKAGIGNKEKNNGLLMIMALKERKLRIEVGYGLEGAIPDGKAGRIISDTIAPLTKQNKYDEGFIAGYNEILESINKEYNTSIIPIDINNLNIAKVKTPQPKAETELSLFWIIVIIIVVIIILILIFGSGIGSGSSFGGGGSSGGGSWGSFGGGYSGGGGSSGDG